MNLAEIKAAAEVATPGPWRYRDNGYAICMVEDAEDAKDPDGFPYVPLLDNIGDPAETHPQRVRNAEFIALSRTAVPWLGERVEELAEALRMIQNGPADVEMVSYSWAAGVATSALASLEDAESTIEDPTEGLPPDLVRVLRDPTITIQRDHEIRLADGRTLFEHLEEWRKAPSNTASADLPEDSA